MPNFWESIGINNTQNSNFDLQGFMKFYQENKNKDPNQMLQQLLSSGNYTQEQLNQAQSKANGILQMIKTLGFLK